MRSSPRYRRVPFTVNRRMAAASASVCKERNTMHCVTEIDISEPRRLLRQYEARTGEKLSMTAYVVTCLSRTLVEHPAVNAMRRGRSLVLFDDVTISTLVERDIEGEKIPEPFGIRAAQKKTCSRAARWCGRPSRAWPSALLSRRKDGAPGSLLYISWSTSRVISTDCACRNASTKNE